MEGWEGLEAPLRQTRSWALTENLVGTETRLARFNAGWGPLSTWLQRLTPRAG